MPLVQQLVEHIQPDILCLQETKVEDALFPLAALQALGFEYVQFTGQKSYNGVAICSRLPLQMVSAMDVIGNQDARHIGVRVMGEHGACALHNFYVPAGGDIPDVVLNPKYADKLRFVDSMQHWATSVTDRTIIVGDFNIAPGEHDVWSHKQLQHVVSHTEPEITRLNGLMQACGWVDTARHFVPDSEKLYSWWSYRNRDWRRSNRGRRLDHIWVTPDMQAYLRAYYTLVDARDWEKPSDHVPIILDIDL